MFASNALPNLPQRSPLVDSNKLITLPWLKSLQQLLGATGILLGTHAQRLSDAPNSGNLYYETDRNYLGYLGNGTQWNYVSGTAYGPAANLFTGLGIGDTGLEYLTSDTGQLFRWSGSAWILALGLVLEDTHANRLANYPAASYSIGQQFFETNSTFTDRQTTYIVQSVSGTHEWVFESGEMRDTSPTLAQLPNDLAGADTGFRYRNSYFERVWEWSGANWNYADGQLGAGSQVATSGSAPQGGLWYVCDGTAKPCATSSATVINITTSNTQASGGNNPMIEGGVGGAQQVPNVIPNFSLTVVDQNITEGGGTVIVGVETVALVYSPPGETNGGLPLRVSMAWFMRG